MRANMIRRIPWLWIFGSLLLIGGLGMDYEWLLDMRIHQAGPGPLLVTALAGNILPGIAQLAFAWCSPRHPRKPGDWEIGIPTVGILIMLAGALDVALWALGGR